VTRQHLLEQLMREIMKYDGEFRRGMRRVQLALMHGTKCRRPITDDRAWHIKAAPQHWLTPGYAGQAGGGLEQPTPSNQSNRTHAPSLLQNTRLSSNEANPLSGSQN
jgi:hypothetical protein